MYCICLYIFIVFLSSLFALWLNTVVANKSYSTEEVSCRLWDYVIVRFCPHYCVLSAMADQDFKKWIPGDSKFQSQVPGLAILSQIVFFISTVK